MVVKPEFDGLIKWTILQKDEMTKVIYTEEKFSCVCGPNDNKQEFKRVQYEKFLKLVAIVYADLTKRWIKVGQVEILYKDIARDNIVINDDTSFYCFLRNVGEILKPPIEVIIKDLLDEKSKPISGEMCEGCVCKLEAICQKCGQTLVCRDCDVEPVVESTAVPVLEPQSQVIIPATPESQISSSAFETKESVIQEEKEEGKGLESIQPVVKTPEPIIRKGSQSSEWSDFELEDVQGDQDVATVATMDDNNNPVIEEVAVQAETVHDDKIPEPENVVGEPTETENREKTPVTTLPEEFSHVLTISEQIVEEPVNFEAQTGFKHPKPKPNNIWSSNEPKKFHAKEMRPPRPGYLDLDRPSPNEELGYSAVSWKRNAVPVNPIKRMNKLIYETHIFAEPQKNNEHQTDSIASPKASNQESPQTTKRYSPQKDAIKKMNEFISSKSDQLLLQELIKLTTPESEHGEPKEEKDSVEPNLPPMTPSPGESQKPKRKGLPRVSAPRPLRIVN